MLTRKKTLKKTAMKKAKGGTASLDSATDILAQAQASSAAMLTLQAEVGAQSRTFTSVSNVLNARDKTQQSAVRNMRA